MDKISIAKSDKQTIYEIYRACRLCGGGAGYKMPIVQNVIDLDNNGMELKQKILECLQIEVHQDDKMPPLICELCVDKVNDFYDFMAMCQQINKRTRMRLGLPLQIAKRSTSDSGDCILGVTEPIREPEDDNEPLSKQVKHKKSEIKKEKDDEPLSKSVKKKDVGKRNIKDVKVKKEPEEKVKPRKEEEKVSESPSEVRKTRSGPHIPGPARATRQSGGEDNLKLSALKNAIRTTKSSPPPPKHFKPIASKELKELLDVKVVYKEEESSRTKRAREKEPVVEKKIEKAEVSAKRVKLSVPPKPPPAKPKPKRAPSPPPTPPAKTKPKRVPSPPPTPPSKTKPKRVPSPPPTPPPAKTKPKRAPSPPPTPPPKPKSKRAASPPPPPPTPPPQHPCAICGAQLKTAQGLGNHMKSHIVTFTNEKWACNPCGEWFCNSDETSAHHKKHKTKPYRCRYCYSVFKLLADYDMHFVLEDCQPHIEVPDKKCEECWRTYPTQLLLDQHRCQGPDGRPGGKCLKCNRMYTLLKNLTKHEATCTVRQKGEAIIDPEVEKSLKNTKIHLTRCDPLLTKFKGESYDVSDVDFDYGFDTKYVYPYRYRVKSEPTTGYDTMVAIGDEVKEYYSRDYVHWDSDDSDSDVEEKKRKLDSLTVISLRTIFSNKLLGKVPRRKRKLKVEKLFENNDFDMSKDIDSIIDNLGQDIKSKNDSANDSDCSESIFGPFKENDTIDANAFDSLLHDNDSQDTENNFELFNSIGENREDSSTDLGNINGSNSQSNDKENNESRVVSNDDSGVRNDEDKLNKDSPVDEDKDEESTENDKISTINNVNDKEETISENTELSESQNNDENSDDIPIDDTSQIDVKENNRVDNLDSNEQISLSEKDIEQTSANLDLDNKVDETLQNSDESTNVLQNPKEINEESNIKVNGQTDKNNLMNDANDSEMDDKKLMDALDAEIGENIGNGDEYSNENNVEKNNDKVSCQNDTGGGDVKIDDITDNFIKNNVNIIDNLSEQKEKLSSDLIAKGLNNLSGMDLDCVSDEEFNFDV